MDDVKWSELRTLESRLDSMSNKTEKLNAILACGDSFRRRIVPLGRSEPTPSEDKYNEHLFLLIQKHHLEAELIHSKDPPPIFDTLTCANHLPSMEIHCPNLASKVCSACRLVSYCSKKCQTVHWRNHKIDCKNPLRSPNWTPTWTSEGRAPSFLTQDSAQKFGIPRALFGNMPALDILKLSNNEGVSNVVNKPLSLAFIASGDLRNVVRTINELPENYQGKLSILLNDWDPMSVCRNFLILMALGLLPEDSEFAGTATHLWYSIFLPEGTVRDLHRRMIENNVITPTMEDSVVKIGSSTIFASGGVPYAINKHIKGTKSAGLTPAVANDSFQNIMMAPQRVDYRDRYYSRLDPSHRVAFEEWRKHGLLYPFGASNMHFNTPNPWLFLDTGELYLDDSTSPLQGWDVQEAIRVGKEHGTTREDIMGCFYFYIRAQLQEFSQRLRRFHVNISMTCMDAAALAVEVKNSTIPGLSTRSFDRIEVSNIVDCGYVGVESVLKNWGPLLNAENKHAALIGLFMNWTGHAKGGRVKADDMGPALEAFRKQYPHRMSQIKFSV